MKMENGKLSFQDTNIFFKKCKFDQLQIIFLETSKKKTERLETTVCFRTFSQRKCDRCIHIFLNQKGFSRC